MNINWREAEGTYNPRVIGNAFHNARAFAVELNSNDEGEFGSTYVLERVGSGEGKSYRVHAVFVYGVLSECKKQFEEWVKNAGVSD